MMGRIAILVSVAGVLSACSLRAPAVPVRGSDADLAALAGEWTGTYELHVDRGRAGEIKFNLKEGRDTAAGHVIMTFLPDPRPRRPRGFPAPVPQTEQLRIAFVRADDGRVTGQLEPYIDPYCGCRLRTTFIGLLRGDRIEGTFRSEHLDGGTIVTGEWRAKRQPVKAKSVT